MLCNWCRCIQYAAVAVLLLTGAAALAAERCEFTGEFAPANGCIQQPESPLRREICLNGKWQFQPVPVPADYRRNQGEPPVLPPPSEQGWAAEPIKIPSPWNVNAWGAGRNVGAGTDHPYWPGSVYFPSYPPAWDHVEMAWMRRTFSVPQDWQGSRIVLHFEAVAGECEILVNGKPAGSHFDKYLPFELDITSLVKPGDGNELLVGVRAHHLFAKQSARFPKMRLPYPCGSETERLAGIWQDVFLLALPTVRVSDTFVKPLVDQDALEIEATLRNDGDREQTVSVGGQVHPWVSTAEKDLLHACEPRFRLDAAVMPLRAAQITIQPGTTAKIVLREPTNGRLKTWSPDSPALYAILLDVSKDGQSIDRHMTRFGWRQFTISGRDLLLNGQKIQLCGDFLHPFGPFIMSRRYVWGWYQLIKDMGGNCVRPHAQIHPRHYLDLADEMGLVVLDETAIFGSSIALNFEEDIAWQRFADHYDGLVLRDRNHPSVVGWSFGNELFAIFDHNQVSRSDADLWYGKLAQLGFRARRLDPTRQWISCDGDEDLRGALPIWSKHFGHGTPLDRVPNIDKPCIVGESGGTYYARPGQLATFNGPRAFENYQGRNEALAIDAYDNIVRMALPRLAYYAASETAWFGVEHLPLGYRDFARLPDLNDGVFFTHAFEENTPGMQIERIPPYVTTVNPGWDERLPLYKPLAMFHAEKAALAKGGPKPCEWDHVSAKASAPPATTRPSIHSVRFIGERSGGLFKRLARLGVPLAEPSSAGQNAEFIIIDGESLAASVPAARDAIDRIQTGGGTAMIMLGGAAAPATELAKLLGEPLNLTDRPATALVPTSADPLTAGFSLDNLYFAEDGADRFILRHGMAGPLVAPGCVLLKASDTDWSLFNTAPEHSKCAAVVLYEQMTKPSGAALVSCERGKGRLLLCSIDHRVATRTSDAFWRRLFANASVELKPAQEAADEACNEDGVLVKALAIGRFGAANVNAAMADDQLAGAPPPPRAGIACSGRKWAAVSCPSKDRFILNQMGQDGPRDVFAAYFSFWVKSPRSLDDLLADGPDAPRFTAFCYVYDKCRLSLNGKEISPSHSEPADYRTRCTFDALPLKKGWNHVLIKVAADRLDGDKPATLAVRIRSNNGDYFRALETAIEPPR